MWCCERRLSDRRCLYFFINLKYYSKPDLDPSKSFLFTSKELTHFDICTIAQLHKYRITESCGFIGYMCVMSF